MKENFGDFLKQEREMRGIPLEEIADNTKIHVRFLKAIENNDYDELPGEVFIKGYIRSYAKSIGTNVDEILQAYDEWVGKPRQSKLESENIRTKTQYIKNQNTKKLLLLAAILAIIAAFLGITHHLLVSKTDQRSTNQSVPPSSKYIKPAESRKKIPSNPPEVILGGLTSDQSEEIIPALVPAPLEKDLEDPPKNDINQTTIKQGVINRFQHWIDSPDESKLLELTIRVNEQSWFNLIIDHQKLEDFILKSGEGKTFRGKKSFDITIGNGKAVSLAVNGNKIELPEPDEKNVIKNLTIYRKPSNG